MKRFIKKYSNRRLYDTQSSSYISNEDVCALLAAGESLQIVAKDGRDITRSVLLTIFMEREQEDRHPLLSQTILMQLLRYHDPLLTGMLGHYLEHSLQIFMQHQDLFRAQMSDFNAPPPYETLLQLMQQQAIPHKEQP